MLWLVEKLIFILFVSIILFLLGLTGIAEYHWPGIKKSEIQNTGGQPLGSGIDIDLSEKILSGAILIRDFREGHNHVESIELARPAGASAKSSAFEKAHKEAQDRQSFTFRIYHSHLEQAAKEYTPDELNHSMTLLKARYRKEDAFQPLVEFAELFVTHSEAYRQNNRLDDKVIKQDMLRKDLGGEVER